MKQNPQISGHNIGYVPGIFNRVSFITSSADIGKSSQQFNKFFKIYIYIFCIFNWLLLKQREKWPLTLVTRSAC